MLRDHRLIAVLLRHLSAAFNKHGKHIRLAVWEVFLHIVGQLCTGVANRHIRRICHHHIVLLRQQFSALDQRQQFIQRLHLHQHLRHIGFLADLVKPGVQSGKVYGRDVQDGAVLFGVPHFGDDALNIGFQLRIILMEILDGHCLNAVALADGVDIGLNAAREETPVILPRLYHHRKIGKLRRTVINI